VLGLLLRVLRRLLGILRLLGRKATALVGLLPLPRVHVPYPPPRHAWLPLATHRAKFTHGSHAICRREWHTPTSFAGRPIRHLPRIVTALTSRIRVDANWWTHGSALCVTIDRSGYTSRTGQARRRRLG